MSAPYWGDLPAPSITDSRQSAEYSGGPHDQRQSLDTYHPRRSNRISVQTTNTESTFNPQSPRTPNLGSQGLAPRPPSYQRRPAHDIALGISDGSRRSTRTSNEYDDSIPPAPDAPPAPSDPRAPPLSYRQPYGQPELPYTTSRHREAELFASSSGQRDPQRNYHYHSGEGNDDTGSSFNPSEDAAARREAARLTQEMAAQPRRSSTTGASERRKKFAIDRSPLQRLELTLDSMTKEEKRARMQAAEQRARDRAARIASEKQGMPVRTLEPPQERQGPRTYDKRQHQMPTEYKPVGADTATSRNVPGRRHAPGQATQAQLPSLDRDDGFEESSRNIQPSIPPQSDKHDDDTPKRNLSFRARAARDEGLLAKQATARRTDTLEHGPEISSTSTRQQDVQENLPESSRGPSYPSAAGLVSDVPVGKTLGYTKSQPPPIPQSVRDKELPPAPPTDAAESSISELSDELDHQPRQNQPRDATDMLYGREFASDEEYEPQPRRNKIAKLTGEEIPREMLVEPIKPQDAAFARRRLERQDSSEPSEVGDHHRMTGMLYRDKATFTPGEGLYKSPDWLNEIEKGTVGTLAGTLLDVSGEQPPTLDKNKAWWEEGGHRRSSSFTAKTRKAEAFDGEYDDTNAPTRFKPPLYLKCGPLLRYCGLRQEKIPVRSQRNSTVAEREIWRGSIMIVTNDADSSYDIVPTLRLFVQDISLLPPPPHQVNGDLSPEYVDPIAGHPKLGRRGETLYVRPVEHLEEGRDLSRDETDEGLFETTRSPPDVLPTDGSSDLPGSFASRRRRIELDGEKVQKYKDVRGFRLHAERGCTFWRFNIEVELRDKQQRIAYRINRGPSMGFWVPAKGQTMNIMFHSCNGFSSSVNPDDLSGPDPMWRDVLNTHQTRPFHVMVGGGDQIYNDCVADDCALFDDWLEIRNPLHKRNAPFTVEIQDQLEQFYLDRYCMWFSQGLFGLATSQIPMVNMYDDHDVFDGFGSYSHNHMNSPVFCGLGAVAFKYYMLFQHQSIMTETEIMEPSWILGVKPGPYINELSRSIFLSLGGKTALLAVDCRTERTERNVVDEKSWDKIVDRLYSEVRRGQAEHLLVLLGVPIAYPRLVWLENILTSRLMDPVRLLGKTGMLGKALNNIDGGVEVLDDLNDHWTAKNHKHERSLLIEDLQDLAIDKSLRVTILSGDVHLAAVGQFYSNPKLGLAKHQDPRYMPNIISSAIVNTPPPDLMADVLNKRNKIHHFDKQTDESMIPMFQHGVDGKTRNNKRLLPHRNWCSIREWTPGSTPPPTPPLSSYDGSASPAPAASGGGLLRKLSLSRGGAAKDNIPRGSVRGSRPPISGGGAGGLLRSLSRRNSSADTARPGMLTRTMSLGSSESRQKALLSIGLGRRSSNSQAGPREDGFDGPTGPWDHDREEHDRKAPTFSVPPQRPGVQGGDSVSNEFSQGDDSYFTAQAPRRAQTLGNQPMTAADEPPIRPFHRTPTGLTAKQMRKGTAEVNLEGGLDICINVEVNPKDPTGITVPYRLLVPKLYYEYRPGQDEIPVPAAAQPPTGFKRLLSLRKKPKFAEEPVQEDISSDEDYMEHRQRRGAPGDGHDSE